MIIKMNKKELTKFSNFWLLQGAQLCCEHEAEMVLTSRGIYSEPYQSLV